MIAPRRCDNDLVMMQIQPSTGPLSSSPWRAVMPKTLQGASLLPSDTFTPSQVHGPDTPEPSPGRSGAHLPGLDAALEVARRGVAAGLTALASVPLHGLGLLHPEGSPASDPGRHASPEA